MLSRDLRLSVAKQMEGPTVKFFSKGGCSKVKGRRPRLFAGGKAFMART